MRQVLILFFEMWPYCTIYTLFRWMTCRTRCSWPRPPAAPAAQPAPSSLPPSPGAPPFGPENRPAPPPAPGTHRPTAGRVSSKQTKINFGSNRNKTKQDLFRFVSWNQKLTISVCFGSFRCFEPIWKQPKQTELFRNKPKKPYFFWKITKYTLI